MMKALKRKQKTKGLPSIPKVDRLRREAANFKPREDPALVGIESRMRKYGLTKKQAIDPKSGTLIGRLSMVPQEHGGITRRQYDALSKAKDAYDAYRKAISAPDSLAVTDGAGGSYAASEGYEDFSNSAIKRWDNFRNELSQSKSKKDQSRFITAFNKCVVQDHGCASMLGDLREFSNYCARYFGV